MMIRYFKIIILLCAFYYYAPCRAQVVIHVNEIGFESNYPKTAVISSDHALALPVNFQIIDQSAGEVVYSGKAGDAAQVADWATGKTYYPLDFSHLEIAGKYIITVTIDGKIYNSMPFKIGPHALAQQTIPAIAHYYRRQRANTPAELAADSHLLLYGSNTRVNLQGGWCDASGDVSKYFSHLAYANFMSPQQIPLVTWSLVNTVESIPARLSEWGVKDSLTQEALWGADYMMRALSKKGYFYMIVFSYFNKDPEARRVVGLHANSITTNEYQAAFREGGGMAIAALARIARWKTPGNFSSRQYLEAARRAFAHLMLNNRRYDDDGKENIIDDYCALMAATELWITTNNVLYRNEARKRAANLAGRLSPKGYFIADDKDRPFWHASDAGLPVIALCRYLDKETDKSRRQNALATIKNYLEYSLHVTGNTANPFGYARQTFKVHGALKDGFFIPHDNETGWWWQGENARLGSLAAAAVKGARLLYPQYIDRAGQQALNGFASRQLSWILGCNPYSVCFMYGFGKTNVPYMHSNFGHGSERGGVSNGITGKEGNDDGSGIDYKTEDNGNEWRWTEQWIPHAAWFLQAVTAMEDGGR